MKYIPKINIPNWRVWGQSVGFLIGGFIAGGLCATYPPSFVPMPQKQVAVPVKPVQTAMVVPDKRTQEICSAAAENVAKMRDELKELRTKAAAKIAPAK